MALRSRPEKAAHGRAVRDGVPFADLSRWAPSAGRPDPLVLLEEQARSRIADLVPVRYGRMAVSPLTFYRGAALPMAFDLAAAPTSGIVVQLCGDAHLSNFGLFASPERALVFDVNDFDETLPGPFEWDVKRLAASLAVAARTRGFGRADRQRLVHHAVRAYRERMAEYAGMRAIEVYYDRVDVARIEGYIDQRARPLVEKAVKSGNHHDALHALPKLTELDQAGRRRIVDQPPIISHSPEVTAGRIATVLASYRESLQEDRRVLLDRYEPVDVALKVVGVGSVGLAAFAALCDGGDGQDPLFLQFKQAEASVLERFLGPSPYATAGERVVTGQRRLQAVSDIMLGWAKGELGRQWYVRQLQDQKGGAVVETMTIDDLRAWGALCGWALARGHARSGDPAVVAGYLGEDRLFDHAMADFAEAYADQTEQDHAALVAAIAQGRIQAISGV